jgi:hypothetical protein
MSGDCDEAVPLYRAFLGFEGLDDRDRRHATKNIQRCGGDPTPLPHLAAPPPVDAVDEPEPEPEPKPEPRRRAKAKRTVSDDVLNAPLPAPRLSEESVPPPPSAIDDRRRSHKVVLDPVGWSLVGGGAIAIAIGVPFQVIGNRQADETTREGEIESEYVERIKSGRRQQAVGTAMIATGSVLAAAGIVRFIVQGTKAKRSRDRLANLGRF